MDKYILLPSIGDLKIQDKVTRSQLIMFWNMLVVNCDLNYPKYNYETIELIIKYNSSSAANHLNVVLRYIGLLRLNYLAAQQQKSLSDSFIDMEKFKLIPSHEIWETALNDFNLSQKEYDIAVSSIKAFNHRELPKVKVEEYFKKVNQLMASLLMKITRYEEVARLRNESEASGENVANNKNYETEASQVSLANQVNATYEEIAATQVVMRPSSLNQIDKPIEEQNTPVGTLSSAKLDKEVNVANKYSCFLRKLKALQKSSTETVVHADVFGPFQTYMHITRPIEKETIEKLEFIKTSPTPQLMFICGSVGDGKSHLLAYLKNSRRELLEDFYIHNDATESYSPTKSAEETLEEILKPFDDGETPTNHIIVAINIGKLHNFYIRQANTGRFKALRRYIDSLKIFETNDTIEVSELRSNYFNAVDFSKVKYYQIDQSGVTSPFYMEVLKKITRDDPENEIYNAWKQDLDNGIRTIVHDNYEMLMSFAVQKRVVDKLVQTIIRNKMIISTRSFYNFTFDILVPSNILIDPNRTGLAIENTLPNLLFGSVDRSDILLSINELDPLNAKDMVEDEIITNIFIHADVTKYVKQLLGNEEKFMFEKVIKLAISKKEYEQVAKYVIRAKALMEDEPVDSIYTKFINYIHSYYKGDYEELEELFEMIKQVLLKWKGTPRENYIYVSKEAQRNYRIAVPVELDAKVDEAIFGSVAGDYIEAPENFLTIGFNAFLFELDLRLFEFLFLVKSGYCPNLNEIEQAIQFEEFYNKVVREAEELGNKFLLVYLQSNKHFEVSKPKSKFTKNKYEVRKV